MSVIDSMYNIVNPETTIKTEIETELKMIWKLKSETEYKKNLKIEIQ